MRRVIAVTLIVSLALVLAAPAAEARHGAPVVVGIGAAVGLVLAAPFIIAGTILAPLVHPPVAVPLAQPPAYAPPAYSYAPPVYSPTPAREPRTVQYPNGRYELRGDGVRTAYRWVWIPSPPPPPPPPEAPPRWQ